MSLNTPRPYEMSGEMSGEMNNGVSGGVIREMDDSNVAAWPISHPHISLVAHQLRFTVRAETDIHFASFKGSALRGALADVLRQQYCPEWRNVETDALHRQLCPICQLLSWEQEDVVGGDLRRPYMLTPPVDRQRTYTKGETFTFGLTLFGTHQSLLPYFVLGVTAMGNIGVGRVDQNGRRGRFTLVDLHAHHPLTGASRSLLQNGRVDLTTLPVTHADVLAYAASLEQASTAEPHLTCTFHTPLRLNQGQQLVKTPNFFPLIKQVVLRVLDLCVQHGGGRPEIALGQDIYPWANRVTLVADYTEWWELAGYSRRLGREQQLGGLIGAATYATPTWSPLLPWLVWGQVVQVGKNTVKGCGVYTITTTPITTTTP